MTNPTATITLQIKCINKIPRNDVWERISHIGGYDPAIGRWKMTLADAIKAVQENRRRFWVSVNGKSVWVVIARSRFNHLYLKTEADGENENNLLSLPECP